MFIRRQMDLMVDLILCGSGDRSAAALVAQLCIIFFTLYDNVWHYTVHNCDKGG